MGWFDSQIKERLEHDEDLVSQAAWDLSVAITGRAAGGAEVDAGKAAADAVGEVLAYYRVKPADAPRDPKSVRDLIDAQLRGTGVMCRRVVLSLSQRGASRTATSPPARRYASIARMRRGSHRKRTASTSPCRSESWA